MTSLLPAPPKAAVETILHRIGAKGRYKRVTIDPAATFGRADSVYIAAYATTRKESTRVADKLSSWGRELFAAFEPLPLVQVCIGFPTGLSRPATSPAMTAGAFRPPLLSLARRVAEDWARIADGSSEIGLHVNIARPYGVGRLIRRLVAQSSAGTLPMDADESEPLWQAAIEPWLDGVESFDMTFHWTRPSAHFLAIVANAEAA